MSEVETVDVNDGVMAAVWRGRTCEAFGLRAFERAARRLGQIHAAWSQSRSACTWEWPCRSCCLRALHALEAAALDASPPCGVERLSAGEHERCTRSFHADGHCAFAPVT